MIAAPKLLNMFPLRNASPIASFDTSVNFLFNFVLITIFLLCSYLFKYSFAFIVNVVWNFGLFFFKKKLEIVNVSLRPGSKVKFHMCRI